MEEFIAGVIVIGGFILYAIYSVNKSTETEATSLSLTQFVDYGWTDSKLTLKERSSSLKNAFEVEESREVFINSKPDQLVYTGATVGGVTTGGFHVEKGGVSFSSGAKTGRYYISYKYGRYFGTNNNSSYVNYIVLSEADYKIAKDDSILKRYIIPKDDSYYGRFVGPKTDHVLSVGSVSKSDATYIVNWMSKST